MMSLPKAIAIGPLLYRVTDDEADYLRQVAEDKLDTWGYIKYGGGKIVLNPDQDGAHKRMALLHEVLHGCWHLTDRAHDDDEKAVLSLAAPLLDVLRRNPDLVAYLLEESSWLET